MLEKSLWMIVNVLMNSEDAIESMLFHESLRNETSLHDNVSDANWNLLQLTVCNHLWLIHLNEK